MENWKGTAGVQSIHNNSKVIKKCREVEVSAFDLDPPTPPVAHFTHFAHIIGF